MNEAKHLVAVYGTLRKGLHNHGIISTAMQVLTTAVKGFTMRSLGAFPVVKRDGSDGTVVAEVYHVTDDELKAMDELEGHPNWYKRTSIGKMDVGDGEQDLYMYLMQSDEYDDKPVVKGGDWNTYQGDEDAENS